MSRIYKWTIPAEGAVIDIPAGSRILHVAAQRDEVCLWAQVDHARVPVTRAFRIYGTGHPMPADPGEYVGTAILHDGAVVFHVYEATP